MSRRFPSDDVCQTGRIHTRSECHFYPVDAKSSCPLLERVSKTRRPSPQALLAAQLVRMRRRKGLTQEQVAHEAGLSRSYVGDIERRKRNITLKTLEKLAAALEVECSQLLDRL